MINASAVNAITSGENEKVKWWEKNGIVTVKAGQILTDGTNTYSGALTGTQLQTLSGKTLVPYKDTGDDITIDVSLIAPEGSALAAETATLTVDGVDYASQDGKFTLTDLPDGDYDIRQQFPAES